MGAGGLLSTWVAIHVAGLAAGCGSASALPAKPRVHHSPLELLALGRSAEAVRDLRIGCDERREPVACSALGRLHLEGWLVTEDAAKARSLFEVSCGMGRWSGCASLGYVLRRGLGGPRDQVRAFRVERVGPCAKASSEEELKVCLWTYELDHDWGRDMVDRVWQLLAGQGCAAGDGAACAMQGKLLTDFRGAPRPSPIYGAFLLHRACELGEPQACIHVLGILRGWLAGSVRAP